MQSILQLIQEHGLVVVFFNVLAGQAGVPVPVYPTMVVTGALYESSGHNLSVLVAVAVLGALVADFAWYSAGRRYGPRLLSKLCRLSLSPDSCIQRTKSIYTRYGPPSLMVAKFIPGFAAIASVLAGTVGTRRRT
ncbi:MAG: DedA family protein, partial [Burkholderiaceae bacterium]